MEEKLLEIISRSIANPEFLGDDCAVVDLASENYLFCVDNFIENTHFSSEYFSPTDIGWKSLAVNISDIAAMAGDPLFALVGLSLNDSIILLKTIWSLVVLRKQCGHSPVSGYWHTIAATHLVHWG